MTFPPESTPDDGSRRSVVITLAAVAVGAVVVGYNALRRPSSDVEAAPVVAVAPHPLESAYRMVLLFADDLAAGEDLDLLQKRRDELDAERQKLRLAGVDVGPLDVALTYVDVQLSIGLSTDRDAGADYVRGGARVMRELMDRK